MESLILIQKRGASTGATTLKTKALHLHGAWFEQLETHASCSLMLTSPYVVVHFKPALYSFCGVRASDFQIKEHSEHSSRGFLASKGVMQQTLNQGWTTKNWKTSRACEPNIRLVNDQVPFAEVQLTTQHNVLANEQQHMSKSETPYMTTYCWKKNVENAVVKVRFQEKVFGICSMNKELRKLKGNSMDTKFAKSSILGKPVLQPPRNQSVGTFLDTSSRSGNDAHVDDVDIRPIYDEEPMAPVRISSGPDPKMMFGQNSSSLVLHQMTLDHNSSSLGLLCQKMFGQNSLGLVLLLDVVWTKQFRPRSSS
ncbi:hypothetical protein Tco_1438522 [Tanacetum coccineum]